MKIQETLMAYLASSGQHAAAQEALASTSRTDWLRLTDTAIRFAPETERTTVAFHLKKALDDPANGGPGEAAKAYIKPEKHPLNDSTMYRGFIAQPDGTLQDTGFLSASLTEISRRLVGMFTLSEIVYPTEGL